MAAGSRPDGRAAGPGPSVEEIAAGAARCGVTLEARQSALLRDFAALLVKWNAVHNLTAISGKDDLLVLHLLDTLAVLPHLSRLTQGRSPPRVLDVGSGGGLPGIPIAVAGPLTRVTLLDKVSKKAAFLTQVRLELGLDNVEVVCELAEKYRPSVRFDVIVSRAVASLADLVGWTRHLLAPGGFWLAMKGAVPHQEIAALPSSARVKEVIALAVPGLSAERNLIVIEPVDPPVDPTDRRTSASMPR